MPYSTTNSTTQLRFKKTYVQRPDAVGRTPRFTLQQMWVTTHYEMDNVPVSQTEGWRDVPTVEDGT